MKTDIRLEKRKYNRKKWLSVLVAALIVSMLSSCSMVGARLAKLSRDNDGGKADAQLQRVINAIKSKDKVALKSMFSKKALSEATDIDGRMDYLFNFVDGHILSWQSIVSGATEESIDYGKRFKKSRSWYYVTTDKEKYLFFLLEYPIDTEHPDNVGLYMLQVIKAVDKDTQFDGGNKILCAGIYKPDT